MKPGSNNSSDASWQKKKEEFSPHFIGEEAKSQSA